MVRRAIIALFLLCFAAGSAGAQGHKQHAPAKRETAARHESAASEDPVVARVNGSPIFRSDVLGLRASLPPQAQQQPMDKLYPRLLDQLVALKLVNQAAHKARVTEEPRVKKAIELSDEQIVQDAYFDGIVRKEITEAKLRAAYDEYVKNAPAREEVHARHILVPTEAEAKEIIQELKKGADFATLAREKTTDPAGKASGGDLGYFTRNEMVPEFAKAAFALKKGQFTETPVKTQFGWHVIQVLDRREAKPASYQEIAPQLARQMAQKVYTARVRELAAHAKIETFNPDGSRPIAAAPPPPAAPVSVAAPAAPPPAAPSLIPIDNGTPGGLPPMSGPPTMAPATRDMTK